MIFPTVAVVAALEPDTAAKSEHAATFTCKSFPGIKLSHGIKPFKSLVEIEDLYKISPIKINIGNAASDHEFNESYIDEANKSPILSYIEITGGKLWSNISIATIAVKISDTPIQIDDNRKTNITKTIIIDNISGSLIIC